MLTKNRVAVESGLPKIRDWALVDLSSYPTDLLQMLAMHPHKLSVQHPLLTRESCAPSRELGSLGRAGLASEDWSVVKREITSTRVSVKTSRDSLDENVVQRLRRRIAAVQSGGTVVRTEWLDGQQASWCEIRGVRTIMLDASQAAADQLGQLDEILTEIARFSPHQTPVDAQAQNRAA